MTHGFDTSFLVAAEVAGHTEHREARSQLTELRQAGDQFAIAPQVLTEFVHVVTDPKRFAQPLELVEALGRARAWWNSPEIEHAWPNDDALGLFFDWMKMHRLGRKRILDTMLAATYRSTGINSLLTTNARDFTVFGGFTCLKPTAAPRTAP